MPNKSVVIVIPAYRAEHTIIEAIAKLDAVLLQTNCVYKILVVIDGLVDNTFALLKSEVFKEVEIIPILANSGKGNALRVGISHIGECDYIGFIDADLDIEPNSFIPALKILHENHQVQIVVGSKLHPDSKVSYPIFRKVQSVLFARLIEMFFHLGISDTQTGLKLARATSLKSAAQNTICDGFAFDLELLVRMNTSSGSIAHVPVQLNFQFDTTINLRSYFKTIREVYKVILLKNKL